MAREFSSGITDLQISQEDWETYGDRVGQSLIDRHEEVISSIKVLPEMSVELAQDLDSLMEGWRAGAIHTKDFVGLIREQYQEYIAENSSALLDSGISEGNISAFFTDLDVFAVEGSLIIADPQAQKSADCPIAIPHDFKSTEHQGNALAQLVELKDKLQVMLLDSGIRVNEKMLPDGRYRAKPIGLRRSEMGFPERFLWDAYETVIDAHAALTLKDNGREKAAGRHAVKSAEHLLDANSEMKKHFPDKGAQEQGDLKSVYSGCADGAEMAAKEVFEHVQTVALDAVGELLPEQVTRVDPTLTQ